jgi:hypothetical protein
MTISGVLYDSHPLTYQRQTFSPNGYLVKVFDIIVPADAPDPATTHIISGKKLSREKTNHRRYR